MPACLLACLQVAAPNAHVLHQLVMEQWLSANLRDIGSGCLPALFGDQEALRAVASMNLPGPLALQIEAVTDAGDSAFRQIEAAGMFGASLTLADDDQADDDRRANNPMYAAANAQAGGGGAMKAARLLVLKLSDGVKAARAMTYRPLPMLTCDTLVGTKVCCAAQ